MTSKETEAFELFVGQKFASATSLMRKLSWDLSDAVRTVRAFERAGIVSRFNGVDKRSLRIWSLEEAKTRLGSLD